MFRKVHELLRRCIGVSDHRNFPSTTYRWYPLPHSFPTSWHLKRPVPNQSHAAEYAPYQPLTEDYGFWFGPLRARNFSLIVVHPWCKDTISYFHEGTKYCFLVTKMK